MDIPAVKGDTFFSAPKVAITEDTVSIARNNTPPANYRFNIIHLVVGCYRLYRAVNYRASSKYTNILPLSRVICSPIVYFTDL